MRWSSLIAAILSPVTLAAVNPAHSIDQYGHTSWAVTAGALPGYPRAIAQTSDGYLWLATEFGLVRFDGARFVDVSGLTSAALPSRLVSALAAGPDGSLWIGTSAGLARLKSAQLTVYPELGGRHVSAILPARDGTVWVGSKAVSGQALLCEIRERATCHGEDGRLGRLILALREDRQGGLWVGTGTELWLWQGPDRMRRHPLPPPLSEAHSIVAGPFGLLVSLNRGVLAFDGGRFRAPEFVLPNNSKPTTLLYDRHGAIWIGTQDAGVFHVHDGVVDRFGRAEGLSGNFVVSLCEDREGNVWVGTLNGLDRFREVVAARLTARNGLLSDTILSVHSGGDSQVWVNTVAGLNRLRSGRVDSQPSQFAPDGFGIVFQDSKQRLWVAASTGLYRAAAPYRAARQIAGPALRQVHAVAEDAQGDVWVVDQREGLIRVGDDEVRAFPASSFGGRNIRALAAAADGGMWLGFYDSGIAHFKDGAIRKTVDAAGGLIQDRVNSLHSAADGSLWVATEGGLSQVSDDGIESYRSFSGLPCHAVQWVITDSRGDVWLHTECGLVQLTRSDQSQGATETLRVAQVYDVADGVVRSSQLGGFGPKVTRTSDGRLWFATPAGLGVIDPDHLLTNQLPPPVWIESASVGRATLDMSTSQVLPPLSRDLRIDFTALSLVAPEKVRFRYKLEGRDSDWTELTERRQALYSDLPPGGYRFHVIASNNHGVWNQEGATWEFRIAPTFYQTNSFKFAVALSALLSLYLLYRLRIRSMAVELNVRFDERLAERARIAQDLHDTLLQGLISGVIHLRLVAAEVADQPLAAKLEGIVQRISGVIDEGRRTVSGLRASPVDRLEEALVREAEGFRSDLQIDVKLTVNGDRTTLDDRTRDTAYQIGREALANAFRHAKATQVHIEIGYLSNGLSLVIRDNGCGIDPRIALEGRVGHWGLPGMRDRAEQMKGHLKVLSQIAVGTEVNLWLPRK